MKTSVTNITLAIGGVFPFKRDRLCSTDTFVESESFVFHINIEVKKPS